MGLAARPNLECELLAYTGRLRADLAGIGQARRGIGKEFERSRIYAKSNPKRRYLPLPA
jgi:hypothetical protein